MYIKSGLSGDDLESLIKGCVKQDRSSQNKLYEMFSPQMLNLCFRYSKSREEAEDILTEGFMKVFSHIQQYKKQGSFEGWMRKIMVNTAIEKYRKKSSLYRTVNIDEVNQSNFSTEDILEQIGAKELIRIIQQLPSGYQIVFNLYAFEGLKHKEIGERLGISEGTSKSNLSDARAILKREITNSLKEAKTSGRA